MELNYGDANEELKKDPKDDVAPQEIIKINNDEMVINNYEVDFEEEAPDLRLLGGVRGIRALRVQRDYMKDVEN